jgi:hypothetical protein
MSDDYLWDRSGKPDPEIAKLEQALSSLGHDERPLQMPEALPERKPQRRAGASIFGIPAQVWAAAAGFVLIAGLTAWWVVLHRPQTWTVARLEGAPRLGTSTLAGNGKLAVGAWLETDATARARVHVGRIGDVVVEPNTRLRLLEAGRNQQRLHLEIGTVTALITAPPRQFVVETPTARAVDLGCAYTLEVDALGGATVTVLIGWVSFEDGGRESFIPAGARCVTRPGSGPGTPCFTDASSGFKNALALLDVGSTDRPREALLTQVLAEARREDGLTLWHLLARLRGDERDRVYTRLAELVPPPAGVTREGIMSGDRRMLDHWWDQLGFGEMKWWRLWQRGWPATGDKATAVAR